MSSYTNSKTLKITSWIFIIFTVLIVVATTTVYLSQGNFLEKINNFTPVTDESKNESIIPLFIIGAVIIQIIAFGIGLILVGKKVKFAIISGILEITSIISVILLFGKFYYDITNNPDIIMSLFFSMMDPTGQAILEVINPYLYMLLSCQIISAASLFFQSLSLFNASKKFE